MHVWQLLALWLMTCTFAVTVNAEAPSPSKIWPQFRGANADGHSAPFPDKPFNPRMLWQTLLPSQGVGGVAATRDFLMVSARDQRDGSDIFVCLDPVSGAELWKHTYPAPGQLDYGNSPRATPIIADPYVYTLGAFGDLHCLDIDTGEIVWQKHLVRDLGGKLPIWGYGWSPLKVKDQLIVLPGGKDCAIASLDCKTGDVQWKTPGENSGYATPQLATWNGTSQVVAYDQKTLGGWDLLTGKRLWTIQPAVQGDFNVPTPIVLERGLFVVTENNGGRFYQVNEQGIPALEPTAQNMATVPDAHSPVQVDSQIIVAEKSLTSLDLDHELETRWQWKDRTLRGHNSLIVGGKQLLVITQGGEILLVQVEADQAKVLGRHMIGDDAKYILAHPALADEILFIRAEKAIQAWALW